MHIAEKIKQEGKENISSQNNKILATARLLAVMTIPIIQKGSKNDAFMKVTLQKHPRYRSNHHS
jgi:hypothetical protein